MSAVNGGDFHSRQTQLLAAPQLTTEQSRLYGSVGQWVGSWVKCVSDSGSVTWFLRGSTFPFGEAKQFYVSRLFFEAPPHRVRRAFNLLKC